MAPDETTGDETQVAEEPELYRLSPPQVAEVQRLTLKLYGYKGPDAVGFARGKIHEADVKQIPELKKAVAAPSDEDVPVDEIVPRLTEFDKAAWGYREQTRCVLWALEQAGQLGKIRSQPAWKCLKEIDKRPSAEYEDAYAQLYSGAREAGIILGNPDWREYIAAVNAKNPPRAEQHDLRGEPRKMGRSILAAINTAGTKLNEAFDNQAGRDNTGPDR